MKKIGIIICLFLLFNIYISKEEVKTVYQEESGYDRYEITFPKKTLSTKYIEKYFEKIEIISMIPYRNPIYPTNLSKNYPFDTISLSKNISNFVNREIKWLENNGYNKEAINAKMNGIYLHKIIIYGSYHDILNLKNIFSLEYKILS